MRMSVVLIVCVAASVAVSSAWAQAAGRRLLPAVQHEEVHDEFGQYALRYVTAEGIVRSERARLVPGAGGYVLVTEGEVSYIAPDGKTYVTKYRGDTDGFHVEGSHLPKAPEVPHVE